MDKIINSAEVEVKPKNKKKNKNKNKNNRPLEDPSFNEFKKSEKKYPSLHYIN